MPARLLDGKRVADSVLDQVRRRVVARTGAGLEPPGLAVVLVGEDPASRVYVAAKRRDCERVGFRTRDIDLPATVSQDALMALIGELNADPAVHGILVQLPLPPALDATALIQHIEPWKDVDGFHPENMGRLALRQPGLRPCTPRGVMTLLAHADKPVHGRHAVVVGASNHVGRPMLLELLMAGCTVTCCHRFTEHLEHHVADADILVVAVGRAGIVPGEWVKPGAIVIDVGITRTGEGRLVGDVGFTAARERAAWITPVPGGVGPMTRAMLLQNTLEAAEVLAPAPPAVAGDAKSQRTGR